MPKSDNFKIQTIWWGMCFKINGPEMEYSVRLTLKKSYSISCNTEPNNIN